MSGETPHLNWHDWMQRWDRQQSGSLPYREQRFTAMLDVVDALLPERFVALDLACGPGSISQRLLQRFPHARCVAIDFDPVLLLLGQNELGDMQGRLRWVEADLRDPSWHTQLGKERSTVLIFRSESCRIVAWSTHIRRKILANWLGYPSSPCNDGTAMEP